MKQALLLIFCIGLSIDVVSQEYQPMVREGVTWKMHTYDNSFPSSDAEGDLEYLLSGDTLINDTTYKKLVTISYSDEISYPLADTVFLRENLEERKVYIRFSDQDTALYEGNRELLLYDFSLNEGDSFFLFDDFEGNEINIIADTVYTIDGEDRRAWITDFPSYAGNITHRIYVEGIGFLSDPLMSVNFQSYAFLESYLFCYVNDEDAVAEEIEYEFLPEGLDCNTLLNSSEIDLSDKLQVFPNPVKSFASIELPAINTLSITDITGKTIVNRTNIQGDRVQVDVRNFRSGLYIVKVCNASGQCGVAKMVIR